MAVSTKKPRTRVLSIKNLAFAVAGPEKEYPTYRFSKKVFTEKPKHNPFVGL